MMPCIYRIMARNRCKFKLFFTSALIIFLISAIVLFHRTFFLDDVHHIIHPENIDGPGWKSKTLSSIEDLYHSSMAYLDFKGDDCKGCLTIDYGEIIAPHRNICSVYFHEELGRTEPQLFLLIFTTFGHEAERAAVRKTWLSPHYNNTGRVRYVFLIGKGSDDQQQKDLEAEHLKHGDILQHNYVECARNMTLKTISGFRWLKKNCANVPHIMKVDSDIWLNIPKWQHLISKGGGYMENMMVGHCRYTPAVIRFPLHRYFVSEDIYPEKRHPSYCRGPAYYLSRKLMNEVADVSYIQPYIAVEDAYVGHCLRTLGYGVFNPPGLTLLDLSQQNIQYDPCAIVDTVYMIHDVNTSALLTLWGKLMKCHDDRRKTFVSASSSIVL